MNNDTFSNSSQFGVFLSGDLPFQVRVRLYSDDQFDFIMDELMLPYTVVSISGWNMKYVVLFCLSFMLSFKWLTSAGFDWPSA